MFKQLAQLLAFTHQLILEVPHFLDSNARDLFDREDALLSMLVKFFLEKFLPR